MTRGLKFRWSLAGLFAAVCAGLKTGIIIPDNPRSSLAVGMFIGIAIVIGMIAFMVSLYAEPIPPEYEYDGSPEFEGMPIGRCALCGRPIMAGDKWEMGDENDLAHSRCVDREDNPR